MTKFPCACVWVAVIIFFFVHFQIDMTIDEKVLPTYRAYGQKSYKLNTYQTVTLKYSKWNKENNFQMSFVHECSGIPSVHTHTQFQTEIESLNEIKRNDMKWHGMSWNWNWRNTVWSGGVWVQSAESMVILSCVAVKSQSHHKCILLSWSLKICVPCT